MDDLIDLNRTIAEHWLGTLEPHQEAYLGYVPICLGDLAPNAAELARVLAHPEHKHDNSPAVTRLNSEYLRLARVAARDALAGEVEMLIMLGIDNFEQARVLASLTNEKLDCLACSWGGPIISFNSQAFTRGAALDPRAARIHAIGFIAAKERPNTGAEA